MTEDEKNTCREIAREIVKETLVEYTKACPHGLALMKAKFWIIGIIIGTGVVNGGVATLIISLLRG